jgi:BTB/POZ domain
MPKRKYTKVNDADNDVVDDDDNNIDCKKEATTLLYQPTNCDKDIIVFDVSGHIFKVRRSVLDTFPDTMLARSASDIWNSNWDSAKASNVLVSITKPPIYIDRDSHIFSYVIKYMRESSVALPITISKDSFLRELQYFGLNISSIDLDSISCSLSVCDAIMQLQKTRPNFEQLTHNFKTSMDDFEKSIENIKRKKGCEIVAFLCLCQLLQVKTYELKATFKYTTYALEITQPVKNDDTMLFRCNFEIKGEDIKITGATLADLSTELQKQKKNKKYDSDTLSWFRNSLRTYGLQCVGTVSYSHCSFDLLTFTLDKYM